MVADLMDEFLRFGIQLGYDLLHEVETLGEDSVRLGEALLEVLEDLNSLITRFESSS